MRQKKVAVFQEVDEKMSVDLTIYDIPEDLLREFGEKVVHSSYPSGVNEAIKDLLRKAIMDQESKRNETHIPAMQSKT